MGDQSLTVSIAQLPPLDPQLLSGEDSVEITISTRADGGVGFAKKTYRTTLNAILKIYAGRRDNPNQVTAEQVGALTVEQVRALLAEKLGVNDVAVNALKLDGKTRQEIVEEARAGTVEDARNLGGLPAEEYLLVDSFQSVMTNVTLSIDELADSLSTSN